MEKDFLEVGVLYCLYCKNKKYCTEFIASHTDCTDISLRNLEIKSKTCAKLDNNLRRTSKEVIQIEMDKLVHKTDKHSLGIWNALETAQDALDFAIKATDNLISESKVEVMK